MLLFLLYHVRLDLSFLSRTSIILPIFSHYRCFLSADNVVEVGIRNPLLRFIRLICDGTFQSIFRLNSRKLLWIIVLLDLRWLRKVIRAFARLLPLLNR